MVLNAIYNGIVAMRVARVDSTGLLLGESGVGKGLAQRNSKGGRTK